MIANLRSVICFAPLLAVLIHMMQSIVVASAASEDHDNTTIGVDSVPLIEPLADDRFHVAGIIVVDRRLRCVVLPAVVNQQYGLVEYLLVHTSGKRHEAVLTTAVRPQHLHVACLLTGIPAADASIGATVAVVWQGHGPAVRLTDEDLLLPATHDGEVIPGAVMTPARWCYHGSHFTADGFAAEQQGSCIALQADAAALMNGPGLPTGDFVANSSRLPPVGTPVGVIITFTRSDPIPQTPIAKERQ